MHLILSSELGVEGRLFLFFLRKKFLLKCPATAVNFF